MHRLRVLVLLAGALPAAAPAAVYKCEQGGETVYSQRPCGEHAVEIGDDLRERDSRPGRAVDPADLRRPRRELDPPRPTPARPDPVGRTGRGCDGIVIHDVATFERETSHYVRRGVRDVRTTQCALVTVQLEGYWGGLFTDHFREDLAERFFLRRADGSVARAAFVESPDGRISTHERYRLRMCFGESEFPGETVFCR